MTEREICGFWHEVCNLEKQNNFYRELMLVDCKTVIILFSSSPKEVSLPFEPGMALWLVLMNRMWQKWHNASLSLGLKDLDASALRSGTPETSCEQVWTRLVDDEKHVAHLSLSPQLLVSHCLTVGPRSWLSGDYWYMSESCWVR